VIGRRGPLADRNFRLLLAARAISYFGTYLAPIAVAFALLDLTGSAADTGIAFACWTVAQVERSSSAASKRGVQRAFAPHLLGRVSANNWMAAMTFLPLGYATAGWIGDLVGMSAYLVAGAAWVAVATGALMLVPDVRDFRLGAPEHADVPAPAVAT
jgi:MFS family permease